MGPFGVPQAMCDSHRRGQSRGTDWMPAPRRNAYARSPLRCGVPWVHRAMSRRGAAPRSFPKKCRPRRDFAHGWQGWALIGERSASGT